LKQDKELWVDIKIYMIYTEMLDIWGNPAWSPEDSWSSSKNPDSVVRADLSGQTSVLSLRSSNKHKLRFCCFSFTSKTVIHWMLLMVNKSMKMYSRVSGKQSVFSASSLTTRTFTRFNWITETLTYKLKCVSVSSEYFGEYEGVWAVEMMVRKPVWDVL